MKPVFMILLGISSIILIASVLLQSGSSEGFSSAIGGGAEQLFGKKKSKGYDALLSKITVAGAVVFILSALVLVTIE